MTPPRRIAAVSPGDKPLTLRVRWQDGDESLIDVSGMIESYKVYAPLRQSPEFFRQVRVGEYGTDVIWTDEIDMSADTLWRLAMSPWAGIRHRSNSSLNIQRVGTELNDPSIGESPEPGSQRSGDPRP